MPPAETADAVRAVGKRKRISSVVDFARSLLLRLPRDYRNVDAANALTTEIQANIVTVRDSSARAYGDLDVDKTGTDLWNLCTRLRREAHGDAADSPTKKVLLYARFLAFLVIERARWSPTETDFAGAMHLSKVALKTAETCLDEASVGLGLLAMQSAVDYSSRLQDLSGSVPEEELAEYKALEAERLAVHIALNWRDNRLHVAEHNYESKIGPMKASLDPFGAEAMADVLFEIGKDLSTKRDFPGALAWLGRAQEVLQSQSIQALSREALELRLAVIQALFTASLGLKTPEGLEKAANLVGLLKSEAGDSPLVLLLELELLNSRPPEAFDTSAYGRVLQRAIQVITALGFPESQFKLLAHHIRKLYAKSPGNACSVLDDLLLATGGCENIEWIEKLVVMRLWMATNQLDEAGTIDQVDKVISRLERPLRPDATIAAQMLIWKKLESNYNEGRYEIAARWCQLALNPLFGKGVPMNEAKIQRKLLLCSIERNDLTRARAAFEAMPEATQREPMTRYVLYKIAVRSGDYQLAAQCLENISSCSNCREFLYACAIDSHESGDQLSATMALKQLADKYDYDSPGPIHLPTLLRCNVRLLYSLLEREDVRIDRGVVVEDLCSIFDSVVNAIQRDPTDSEGNRLFNLDELDWFCRNAYNVGLKHASTWQLDHVVRILNACVRVSAKLASYPASCVDGDDLSLKTLFCHFMISAALASLARAEEGREQQPERYRTLRKHVNAFDTELQRRLGTLDDKIACDLRSKLSILFIFDFEAAVNLEDWKDLGEVVRRAAVCKSTATYEAIGDCLLRSRAPDQELFSAMRAIIRELEDLGFCTTQRLAKYFRCLFQALLHRSNDPAFQLLDEACRLARDAWDKERPWPQEEVEWVAVMAFNKAVDWYGAGEDVRAKEWGTMAMTLAHYCDDKGSLEVCLRERYLMLSLGD